MRNALLVCATICATATSANAIGICERMEDTVEVVGYSATLKELAIARTREDCEETEDMEEERTTFDFVEIVDRDGRVKLVFYDEDTPNAKEQKTFEDMVGAKAQDQKALRVYLKKGAFKKISPRATSPHRKCRVRFKAEGSAVDFKVNLSVRNKKGSVVLDKELAEASRHGRKLRFATKVFWVDGLLVIKAVTPELYGPAAPDGSFDQEEVENEVLELLSVKDNPALAACF